METAKSFEQLQVWQKAHSFVLAVYKHSSSFPKEEMFGLTSQLRRASVSIAANIAEGFKRLSSKDKLRFYNISQSSLEECRYYLILSRDLEYIELNIFATLLNLLEDASRMLNAYCRTINKAD